MHADIERRRPELADLCRRYAVARLEVFGSAARGTDFDPENSDIDFLVEFAPANGLPGVEQYFGFAAALETLLGRPIDLVQDKAIENPYVRASVDRSRELVYGT
jgi:predicted nucleotidyltransferase